MRTVASVLTGVGAGGAGGLLLAVAGSLVTPLFGILLVVGTVGVAAMLVWADFGFLLAVLVVPIERLGRFADDSSMPVVSLMRIVGAVALASLLLHAALQHRKIQINVPILLYSGYVAVCAATVFYALVPPAAFVHATTVLGNLLFLFLVVNAARDWRLVRLSVIVWIGATLAIAAYQLYDWHFGSPMDASQLGTVENRFSTTWRSTSESTLGTVRQATGTSSGAAAYGINLLMTVPFLIWRWRISPSRWQTGAALGALGLIAYNLMLTNSRAVLIFGAACVGLCLLWRLLVLTPVRLMLGCCTAIIALPLLPAAVWQRALSLENYLPENSYNLRGRFELWKAAWRVIADYWLTGVGGNNWWILPKYSQWDELDTDAIPCHNEYLQTMVDTGIVGWLFFIGFLAVTFLYASRTARRLRRTEGESERYWFMVACQICLLTVYLFGVQVDVFHNPLKGWWLIAGLSCATYRMTLASGIAGRRLASGAHGVAA